MDAAQRALCIVAKYKRGNLGGQSSAGGVAASALLGKGKEGRKEQNGERVPLLLWGAIFQKKNDWWFEREICHRGFYIKRKRRKQSIQDVHLLLSLISRWFKRKSLIIWKGTWMTKDFLILLRKDRKWNKMEYEPRLSTIIINFKFND